jgi:spermidine/putrescine transport system permease protein
VGLISTVAATILGTLIAFALGRHQFKGRSTTNTLIFLPMATPEVVLGASLLAMFLNLGINPGFWPVVIAHIMFCISFVVVTVKARIASLDPRLEQAAMDLYANSLSFDDFIITNFNSGTLTTFPKFVYVASARGIPAQANVIGSAMFFLALFIVIAGQLVSRRKAR